MSKDYRYNYGRDAETYRNNQTEEEHCRFMSERCRDKDYDFNRLWDILGLDNDR